MSKKNEVFDSWKDWARKDWREFCIFFNRRYGVTAFQKAELEFSKQMQISYHGIQELTSMAIGKGIEYGISASVGNILSISDFMSKIAGFGFYVGKRNQDYSRYNPHTLVGTSVWSDEYTFKESALQDYIKYILYCYPKDLDEGYRGFRYGAESDKGDCGKLIKIK